MSASATVPGAAADHAVAASDTSKSMHEFSQCFLATQERQNRPVWVVPNEGGGGRISNEGARGVASPYLIRVRELGAKRRIEASIAVRNPVEEQAVAQAIRNCL